MELELLHLEPGSRPQTQSLLEGNNTITLG